VGDTHKKDGKNKKGTGKRGKEKAAGKDRVQTENLSGESPTKGERNWGRDKKQSLRIETMKGKENKKTSKKEKQIG